MGVQVRMGVNAGAHVRADMRKGVAGVELQFEVRLEARLDRSLLGLGLEVGCGVRLDLAHRCSCRRPRRRSPMHSAQHRSHHCRFGTPPYSSHWWKWPEL